MTETETVTKIIELLPKLVTKTAIIEITKHVIDRGNEIVRQQIRDSEAEIESAYRAKHLMDEIISGNSRVSMDWVNPKNGSLRFSQVYFSDLFRDEYLPKLRSVSKTKVFTLDQAKSWMKERLDLSDDETDYTTESGTPVFREACRKGLGRLVNEGIIYRIAAGQFGLIDVEESWKTAKFAENGEKVSKGFFGSKVIF